MSKKITVTITATYDLTEGEIADEYREQLMDYRDSKSQRKWFAIDRFIGEENLDNLDPASKLVVTETA